MDKEDFEALLEDLYGLIKRIHELIGNYREKQIYEITAKTYREIVAIRDDVTELKVIFDAVTSLMKMSRASGTADVTYRNENNEIFRDLLRLNKINCISDHILLRIHIDDDTNIENNLKDVITIS